MPRQTDSALTLLAGRTATGQNFFELAAQALALGLDACWAAVARIREAREPGAGELVETLAFWADGRIVDGAYCVSAFCFSSGPWAASES